MIRCIFVVADRSKQWIRLGRLLNTGIQLVVTVLLFAGLGWWIDGELKTAPVFLAIGTLIGAGVGLYSIIREMVRVAKEGKRERNG